MVAKYRKVGKSKMELKYRELNFMPFDKAFEVDGIEQLCHATGMEIQDERGDWWNEYTDSNGDFHYGR